MNLELLNEIDSFVWGPPLLVLLVGTGVFLSLRLGFLQVARLPKALGLIFKAKSQGEGDTSSFRALCTALAATIGTGNIVGVATAVKAGGPGALFWMWVAAFFGMATKYAEGLLAVKYRGVDEHGEIAGGPMFYIENGMGRQWKPLAVFFAAAGVLVAYFGIGTFAQVNSIVDITKLSIGLDPMYTAVILTLAVAAVTIGGLQSIASVASKIVPAMAVIYFVATVGFLLMFIDKVPGAVMEVLRCAFTPTAAAGGFAGASVMLAMRSGVARGVFSNESGLGSAPIVAAAAKTKWPAEQGLVSMTGTFIDTIIICTLTGLTERGGADTGRFHAGLSGSRENRADGGPGAVCLHHHFGLELLRGALHRLSGRCEGYSSVPSYFYCACSRGRFSEVGGNLGAGGYCQRPHGDSEPDRPAGAQRRGGCDEVNGLLPDGPEEVIEQKLEGR